MSSDLLGIAVSGLKVSQSALSTAGHNISNAGVDGYSRQIVSAETSLATPLGGFYVGNGATVASIDREVNQFLIQQLRTDTTLFNELDAFQSNIAQLDSLLSDASTGMAGAFETFFSSMQNAADDPTSIPARQLVISEAENLANRFNTVYSRLVTINEGINSSLDTAVSEVNALVSNVAGLNQKIADAYGTGNGEPNDLLDQRDQTLKELSQYISFQSYEQGFGEVNILIANGQNLVVGSEARQIAVTESSENPENKEIVFVGDSGERALDSSVLGGEIGGLFRFRDDSLSDTYNELGRIAVVVADTFNTAHENGLDLNSEFGGGFFFDVNDQDIALDRVIAHEDNAAPNDRVMSLNILDSSQLSLSDYQVEMVNDGLYSITRLSDNTEVARGLMPGAYPFSVEFDGLELEFERGSFQAGDEFLLQPVRTGARDFTAELVNPEELAFASPLLSDSSLGNQGSATISPGQVLSLTDSAGDALPLFATAGQMNPPLVVRFTSDTSYEILDNSDPGNPVALTPPISNQSYIPGVDNYLFSSDPGETLVQMNGASTGLPVGSTVSATLTAPGNAYPAETFTISRPSSVSGAPDITHLVSTSSGDSARTTASVLNNIDGVTANASTYAELSGSTGLVDFSYPLQITLNGEDLIEHEFDTSLGTYVIASSVPNPNLDEQAFNDYIANRVNSNSALQSLGISASVGLDSLSGNEEIQFTSTQGDDLEIALETATATDSLNVSDGSNPALVLSGTNSSVSVGGTIDLQLADSLTLSTTPVVSALFGDSSALDFAESNYLGIQASIRGTPQKGDTFTLDFNVDAASDNRNALNFIELESAKTIGDGVSSYTDSYASLVEIVGIDTSSANINRDAAQQVLEQSEDLRNSISAVNLDEEAADLIRFEQMYSANAQVISVARNLFDTLIASF